MSEESRSGDAIINCARLDVIAPWTAATATFSDAAAAVVAVEEATIETGG